MSRPIPVPDWDAPNRAQEDNDMEYEQAVAEAKRLVKRSEEDQWRLAELTWEQVEAGKSRAQWARDINIEADWAEDLYLIWNRWKEADPPHRPKFNKAREEFKPSTSYQAKLDRGARQALADPEAIRQAVAENPEVRKALVEDQKTYDQLSQARIEHIVERADSGEPSISREEYGRGMQQAYEDSALLQLSRVQERLAALQVRFKPQDFAEELPSDRDTDSLESSLTRDIDYLEAIRKAVRSSRKPRLVSTSS